MTRQLSRLALIAAMLCGIAVNVSAEIITFNYTAVAAISATVTGTFGYDDSVLDVEPSPETGLYPAAGFVAGAVTGGPQDGFNFSLNNLDTLVGDFPFVDELSIGASPDTHLMFMDDNGTAITGDDLPLSLHLSDFESPLLFVEGREYQITSITRPVSVAEPAALALLGIGLAGLAFSRRTRAA
jgi:PEP-CTERM motif